MAQTLSPAEFLAAVEKSKLLDPAALEPYRGSADRYPTADALADALLAEGLLTRFQAEHLRAGKYQGFFLGPYKMLEKLGAGATAIVYLAEHTRLKQRVAVKVLSFQKAADAEALGRFEREAKAAAAVRHPHIIHAFDVATAGRLHYMVMEYVNGATLLKKLTDGGRMPPRLAARMMHQAAQGLHAAHLAGIVHRDLKPSNFMIDADGAIKVMDLGLARYEADESVLTQGKAVIGQAAYCAPEQMMVNATVDARADVYGLGATFILAATGKRPAVVGDPIPDVPARVPTEDADYRKLLAVIGRMVAARPEERYQSMADVSAALAVSGLLADPAAKKTTAAPQAARPLRPTSRPTVDLPPVPKSPSKFAPPPPLPATFVAAQDEVIPYAAAVADAPTAAPHTPLPARAKSAPWPMPKSQSELDLGGNVDAVADTLDFRTMMDEVKALESVPVENPADNPLDFRAVTRTAPPAAVSESRRPRQSASELRAVPAAGEKPSGGAVKWVVCGVTFVAVLGALIVLFR